MRKVGHRPSVFAVRLAPWILAIALVGGWAVTVDLTGVPSYILPSPAAVGARLITSLTDPSWWPYAGTTALEAVGGCIVGAAVALPLAVLIHRFVLLDAAVSPFLGATQAIPAIAIAPLLVLWVGYGLSAVVALCALMVFFPILVASVVGLRHVDGEVTDAARLDGAGSVALLVHVEFPLALPTVLAGLRNGFALSVTGAVVGEMVMGGDGLGQLLTLQRDAVDTAGMMATIVVLCVLASSLYGLVLFWERRSRLDAPGSSSVLKGNS